jgi:hypothetical protein
MLRKNLANPHGEQWGFLLGISGQIKSDRLIKNSRNAFPFPLSLCPDKWIMLLEKPQGDHLTRSKPRILINALRIIYRTFWRSFASHIFT